MTVAGGIAWKPTPQWNLEIDADYTDWSSLDRVTIHHFNAPNPPLQQDYPFNLYWRPSWIFSAGLTRYFDNGWHVSAGYVFNQSSVPDAYYSPLIADVDRHFLSFGVGRKGRKYDFDVAYQFGYGPDHKVAGSTPSSSTGFFIPQTADGTYSFVSHAVLMTVGIRF
jgi:long-chain fatty acid transport protein